MNQRDREQKHTVKKLTKFQNQFAQFTIYVPSVQNIYMLWS